MTIWKPLAHGPRGRWMASDEGQIKRVEAERTFLFRGEKLVTRRLPERILKQRIGTTSATGTVKRPVVQLYCGTSRSDSKSAEYAVDRLVAGAFYGLPYRVDDQRAVQKWTVRHKDGDLMNCRASNLQWVHRSARDGDYEELQTTYERNLAAFEKMDAGSVLSRLYAETA